MAQALYDNFMPQAFQQYQDNSLLVFIDGAYYNEYLVTEQYAVAKHHSGCQIPNCTYHILLYSENKQNSDILNDLSGLQFRYFEVDDFHGHYTYQIHEHQVIKKGYVMEKVEKSVEYLREHPKLIHQPSVIRKRVFRKKTKLHRKNHLTKNISTQTINQGLQSRIDHVMNGPYAHDFMQMIDCLYDKHGFVISNKVYFFVR